MKLNEWVPMKKGGRKAPPGGMEHFANFENDWREITELPKVEKDISKYDFDLENLDYIDTRTTSTGLDFIIFEAGGDWEFPLYFFVYYDGKDMRGYVPTRGNCVNILNKAAFGNGEDIEYKGMNGDLAYVKKFKSYLNIENDFEDDEDEDEDGYDEDDIDVINDMIDEFSELEDLDMCIEEFENRVEVDASIKSKPFKVKRLEDMPDATEEQAQEPEFKKDLRTITLLCGREVYWDCIKARGKWLFIIAENEKHWCTDSNFTYTVMMFVARGIMANREQFMKSQIRISSGCAMFENGDGSEFTDEMAQLLISDIEETFPGWHHIDAEELVERQFAKEEESMAERKRQEEERAKAWEEEHNKNIASQDISEVYWNVIYQPYDKEWNFIFGQDNRSMSDDCDWNEAVYREIEKRLPEFRLEEEMEACAEIIYNGGKNDGKRLQYKPEIEYFKNKMKEAFPEWGISRITRL